jgi:hypothetical protein
MVLLSLGVLNSLSRKDNFQNSILENNGKYIGSFTLGWIMALLVCFNAIPAILVAINCNKKNPIFYGLFALLFSDLYLIQWSIKKFIFKIDGYCKL